jgi:hypothetical protein
MHFECGRRTVTKWSTSLFVSVLGLTTISGGGGTNNSAGCDRLFRPTQAKSDSRHYLARHCLRNGATCKAVSRRSRIASATDIHMLCHELKSGAGAGEVDTLDAREVASAGEVVSLEEDGQV